MLLLLLLLLHLYLLLQHRCRLLLQRRRLLRRRLPLLPAVKLLLVLRLVDDERHVLVSEAMGAREGCGIGLAQRANVSQRDWERLAQRPRGSARLAHRRLVEREHAEVRGHARRLLGERDLVGQRLRVKVSRVVAEEARARILLQVQRLVLDGQAVVDVAHLVAHCWLVGCIPPLVVNDELILICARQQIEADDVVRPAAPHWDALTPLVERARHINRSTPQ